VRLLHGLRDHAHVVDLEEAAVIAEALLGPGAHHDLHGLVEALAAFHLRDAIAAELRRPVSPPHPDVEPALRDDVHQRHLLGQPDRIVEGQDGGGQADPDLGSPRGHRAGEGGGVHREAVVDEVMLGEPDLVEAELLRPHHLVELARDDVGVPVPRWGLQEEIGPEAHQATPR
jgi:hypothetical protein